MALRRPKRDVPPDETAEGENPEFELPPIRVLTLEESQAFFDQKARELLGISGAEFVRRYHAGYYDDILDDSDHSDVMYLAMLGALGS